MVEPVSLTFGGAAVLVTKGALPIVGREAANRILKLQGDAQGRLVTAAAAAIVAVRIEDRGKARHTSRAFLGREPSESDVRKILERHAARIPGEGVIRTEDAETFELDKQVSPAIKPTRDSSPVSAGSPTAGDPTAPPPRESPPTSSTDDLADTADYDAPVTLWLLRVAYDAVMEPQDSKVLQKIGMPSLRGYADPGSDENSPWLTWFRRVLHELLEKVIADPAFDGLQQHLYFAKERFDAAAAHAQRAASLRAQQSLTSAVRAIGTSLSVLASVGVGLLVATIVDGSAQAVASVIAAALAFVLLTGVPVVRHLQKLRDNRVTRRVARAWRIDAASPQPATSPGGDQAAPPPEP